MKKTMIIAGVATCFASAVHAQSSVTLYGLIDAGITYTNNQGGHSNVQATSGSVSGSRWGLRGSEDLGGGLKAIFTLETGSTSRTASWDNKVVCSVGRHLSAWQATSSVQ